MSSPGQPPTPPRDPLPDAPPGIGWLLQMLCCWYEEEPVDVHIRPNGDRRRENKVHVPAGDRAVLWELLVLLRDRVGPVPVEGNPVVTPVTSPSPASGSEPGDEPTLSPLALDVLDLLRRAGKPLLGKVIAARLGRKYDSYLRRTLCAMVEAGHLDHGKAGYRLPRDAPGGLNGDAARCTGGP